MLYVRVGVEAKRHSSSSSKYKHLTSQERGKRQMSSEELPRVVVGVSTARNEQEEGLGVDEELDLEKWQGVRKKGTTV